MFTFEANAVMPGESCVQGSDPLCQSPFTTVNGTDYGVQCRYDVGIACDKCYAYGAARPAGIPVGACKRCKKKSTLGLGVCGHRCNCRQDFRLFGEQCCKECKFPCAQGACLALHQRKSICESG
jgi:hypothetical protein